MLPRCLSHAGAVGDGPSSAEANALLFQPQQGEGLGCSHSPCAYVWPSLVPAFALTSPMPSHASQVHLQAQWLGQEWAPGGV